MCLCGKACHKDWPVMASHTWTLKSPEAVAAMLPYGTVEVTVEKGGVTAEGMGGPGDTVIVAAAVTAVVDIPEGKWRLVDADG